MEKKLGIGIDSVKTSSLPPNGAPSGLAITVVSDVQLNLSWNNGSTNEDGISIERSADGVTYAEIYQAAAAATSYNNTGLTAGTKYYYRLRAFKGSKYSAYCSVVNATTWGAEAPTGLVLTIVSDTAITLNWTNNDTTGDGVSVERSTDGVTYAEVDTVALGVATFANTGLTANTLYYYRIRAFKN